MESETSSQSIEMNKLTQPPSNNWTQRFDELVRYGNDFTVEIETSKLRAFISQELDKAREEGRQERYDTTHLLQVCQEERNRILQLIEEMKLNAPPTHGGKSWNHALEALKNKLNEKN